jgi:nitrogen-specific signal transduction histidine kinase
MQRTDSRTDEIAQLLAVVQTRHRYYRDVLSLIPAGVVVLAADGSIRYANSAFCRQFSAREDSVQNRNIREFLPGDVLELRIPAARLSGIAQRPFHFQIRNAAWRISIAPIDNWKTIEEIGSILFIEDPREIQQASLEANKLSLSLALPGDRVEEQIPALIWQARRADLVFHSLFGAEEILGLSIDHWQSTPDFFSSRIHPEDRAGTLRCYRTAIAEGGDASAEFRGLSANGFVWLRETIRVTGPLIAGVITPVGARKSFEEQRIRNQRIQVLSGLARRSADGLHAAVRTVRSSSVGNVSEEIAGPLDHIARIANQLDGLGASPSNAPTVLNMHRILEQAQSQIAAIASPRVSVEFQAQHSVLAFAEEGQLEEVLNAITASICRDALEGSKLFITCDLHTLTEQIPGGTLSPGSYARLAFHHRGRGLEFELQEPLFESLLIPAHAKRATLPALARAYAVVREWGGDIAFATQPDGATFSLYLPYCPSFDLEPDLVSVAGTADAESERQTSFRDLVDLFLAELATSEQVVPDLAESFSADVFETDGNLLERPLQ